MTADLKAMAQSHTPAVLRTLVYIMENGESHAARVAAAKELLDRGHGRPHQSTDVTVREERMVVDAPQPVPEADEWANKHKPVH